VALAGALLLAAPAPAAADDDLDQARKLFRSGEHARCLEAVGAAAATAGAAGPSEPWILLEIEARLAVGDHAAALTALERGLERYSTSIRLRFLGREVCRRGGDGARAEALLSEVEALVKRAEWRYTRPDELVILGRLFLLRGADARQVLELVYDRVKKEHPEAVDVWVAAGDLALAKHDYAVAGEELERARKLDPADPEILYRLALARAPGDPAAAAASLEAALDLNPRHAPSLLFEADRLIDHEEHAAAAERLARVLEVNPRHGLAWAYRSVLAHLEGDAEREAACRKTALESWPGDPEVDHTIGRKLSQKYRFAEGAAAQRRALLAHATHLPAKLQLAQDLLRLGEEDEGWRLAAEAFEADPYSVVAYNLSTLHDHLAAFRTLEADGFIVRMDEREAEVYGDRVLALLTSARAALCARYDVAIERPVFVEIFPEQKDFAIRTFGLPGGAGFLGVCFGHVITATSPASQGEHPSSWEAVLWHELCHVVTLQKTRSKMPRWLSEGISVYEERRADSGWGQGMTAEYREMILGGELTPVGRLSSVFLSPRTPLHLQFAYYESSLVVEHIVERHGLDALKKVLDGLAAGTSVNDALERATVPLADLEKEFAAFALARAEGLAPRADFEEPEPPPADERSLAAWCEAHPASVWGLRRLALELIGEGRFEEAKGPLSRLLDVFPEDAGPGNAYSLLASAHRELGESAEERAVLEKLAARDADAAPAHLRLAELALAAGDWRAAARSAERLLGVNPLLPAAHRHLARAAEELGEPSRAAPAYRAELRLEPLDPAGTHFRLARALHAQGDAAGARRQVLRALEEAPRFRAAHRMLLELGPGMENGTKAADGPPANKERGF
jgi:tetratricopeptide (TPR) repeat protein